MKKRNHLLMLLLAAILATGAALKTFKTPTWNPDAGFIPSWTVGATVTATSNQTDAWKVLDGDLNTPWQSGGVVPGKTDGTIESVTIDFGQVRPVGQIHSRHWAGEAGTATATRLYSSTDGKNWQNIAELDPTALHTVVTVLPKEIPARYLRLEHQLVKRDWNKVYFWEVKAYDRFGPYGQRPAAVQGHSTIKEMLGVNGYWSFGTDEYSDKLGPDGGPFRFKPVASHLRNYHDLTWDLKSPSDPIDFEKMTKGGGTPATEWLNWDREYKAWHEGAGMNVQASIQIYRFKPEEWKHPREDGRRYTEAFTRHFGAKHGNGYICSIEAGNEPWHYPAEVYREILLGMAEGAEKGDPTVEVFPCALQAVDPHAEKFGQWKNYIGDRITPESAKLLDGINIHCYSYVTKGDGKRQAVQPEQASSSFWEMLNAIRWRNVNMPGKKIYLSEWGWDSDGAGENCTHDECVSEQAAADYAVRGALIAARLGIDRATWFFHANDKTGSSLYTRSGLLGSLKTGFAKKKAFFALEALVSRLGNKYFIAVLEENERSWIYKFGDADGKVTHLVAWQPCDSDSGSTSVSTVIPIKAKSVIKLDVTNEPIPFKHTKNSIEVGLNGTPVLIELL